MLDARRDKAHLARAKLGHFDFLGRKNTHAVHVAHRACRHKAHLLALADRAIDHAHQNDDAQIRIVPAIHQQRLQRLVRLALGRGKARDDGFQNIVDPEARFGRNQHRVRSIQPDHVLDLLFNTIGLGGGKINLVQNRHDFMIVIESLINIRQSLRLDPLRGVHNKDRTFARGKAAADFIREIHMAGRIHQVELVRFAVLGFVAEAHRLRLDRNPPFTLDIHAIEHLLAHVAQLHRPAILNQPIRQRRFAVVDVRNDGEIADMGKGRGHGGFVSFV